jgi:hypothetical protein
MNGFEESLKPCINVLYVDSYRRVLKNIVEGYRDRKSGVSFYHLYKKERVLSSANILKKVLDTLLSCGYVIYEKGSAETNSPMGRKDYYPTPLGVFIVLIYEIRDILEHLKKLYFESWHACAKFEELVERGDIEKLEEIVRMCMDEFGKALLLYSTEALIKESLEKIMIDLYVFTKHLLLTKSFNASNLNTGFETASFALYTLLMEFNKFVWMWLDEYIQNRFTRENLVKGCEYELREVIGKLKMEMNIYRKILYSTNAICEGIEKDRDFACIKMDLINSLENTLTLVVELIKGSQKGVPTS